MSLRKMLNPSLLSAAHTSSPETIYDFLAKPFPVMSGVLSSADTTSTFARPFYFYDILNQEPYASKLKGFLGIRADLVVRLVVNANKFQQGRYLLGYCPFGGTGLSRSDQITAGTRFANLTTITQLPHTEIDLSTQTSCVIEIPYTNLYSHLPANATDYALTHAGGRIFLIPYSPLVSAGGSTTAPFDLFVSFKNVDLAAPVYPQSTQFNPKAKEFVPSSAPAPSTMSVTETEQKKKKIGPIETIAKSVGAISNAIGDLIPSLTSLTAPVAWACAIMRRQAHAYGWSNPINLEHAQRVNQTAYPYAANCDNVDNSMPLSLFSANSVEILPGFAGNDIDEMCIDYIKAKPAYFQTISWSESTATNTSLVSYPIAPGDFFTSFASGSNTVITHTPLSFLSQFFTLYRGGIRVTFKIVKTDFHSGRLMLVFNPTAFATPVTPPNNPQSTYCHRQIIDIRDGCTFDFIIPYVALAPYKKTTGDFSTIGTLDVRVLNPLVAPATVSSTVSIIVEVAGAPDIEFAVPNTHDMQLVNVYNPQSSNFVPKKDESSIVTGIIGNATLIHDEHFSARACIGEKVVSLLSYLKKSDTFPTTFSPATFYTLDPFAFPMWYTTATVASKTDIVNDNLSLISSMYLYNRGGVRWRQFKYGDATTHITTAKLLTRSGNYTGYTLPGGSSSAAHGLAVYNSSADGSLCEIQVPQYHRFHSRLFTDSTYNTSSPSNPAYPTSTNSSVEFGAGTTASSSDFSRQAADDFQCGFFLGVPPVIIVSTAV